MNPASLFTAATTSYAANCALGAGVALGVLNTRNAHWVHHALYTSTVPLGAENRKLVAGSPLLIGVMLDRSEYRPGKLPSQYVFRETCATPQAGWDEPLGES